MKWNGINDMAGWIKSPSMRREWIEMSRLEIYRQSKKSPSMRREWIEMLPFRLHYMISSSPSMRREWIEMLKFFVREAEIFQSPSMRREWIEMNKVNNSRRPATVSLHAEGVD